MNIEKGYRALALIKERFGQHVDPDEAFKLIDHTLRTGYATNVGLKQVICATAFDRGMLLGMVEKLREAERLLVAEVGLDAWLALPTLADEAPEPADDKPRIIT